MPRQPHRTKARDEHVRNRFRYHRKKNPKWMIQAVIDEVAAEVFLSPVTVAGILKKNNEDVPAQSTISRFFNRKVCDGSCQQLALSL